MYKWKANELDPFTKIPFSCGPVASYLVKEDKDGNVVESGTFYGQEDIDQAWMDGFHEPGKPETKGAWPIKTAKKLPRKKEEKDSE